MERKLFRSQTDKMLGGVCGGLAQYLGIDSTWVRIFFVLLLIGSGVGFPIYVLLWIVIPSQDQTTSGDFSAQARQMGQEFKQAVQQPNPMTGRYIGIALIGAGLLFFLNNLNLPFLEWFNNDLVWPLVIIVAGIFLLARAFRQK
jgi:phage shock protein PspC (stress-responsive transcriptional regulator)